jgi:hypothetical protein
MTKDWTDRETDELARIAALRDDEIDTTDIPEAPAENWNRALRGTGQSSQQTVTLHLPPRLVAAIETIAATCEQTPDWVMQRALRRYLASEGADILAVRRESAAEA